MASANDWNNTQRTLHLRSQLTGDVQGCGQEDDYKEIVEELYTRFELSKRRTRYKLATLKIKANCQYTDRQQRSPVLVGVPFLSLADADKRTMGLKHFTEAWKSMGIQRHLLAVAPTTIKDEAQAAEDYLAISWGNLNLWAMPVEQVKLHWKLDYEPWLKQQLN